MTPTSNPQNNNSAKPAVTSASTSSKSSSIRNLKRSPILAIIVALLIPPLGLIVALVVGIKSKRPRKVPLIITLLVASILGTIGYLTLTTGLINVGGSSVTKYNYQNANGDEFSTVQAGGMLFSKPSEFTATAKKSDQNYSTESFAHFGSRNYPLSYIFVFSYKDSHTNDAEYIKGINDFMSGAVKNSYSADYIDAIKKQVFDSYPGYDATLSAPHKFTNANIKKNAWSFDLDITNADPTIKPMKGKLVYVLGPGTIYYFSLMVTEDNWTQNITTWQTVLDSLKLYT